MGPCLEWVVISTSRIQTVNEHKAISAHVNCQEGSWHSGEFLRTLSYEPPEDYRPPGGMDTRALPNPARNVRFLQRILS